MRIQDFNHYNESMVIIYFDVRTIFRNQPGCLTAVVFESEEKPAQPV